MQRPIHNPELYPSINDVFQSETSVRRRKEFFEAVTQPDYIVAADLNIQEKTFPNINAPLAIRDDLENFGVKQILCGIIRAGDDAYGIVGAFGAGPLKNGFMFAVHLAAEPYSTQPDHVAHLPKGKRATLGDRHLLAGFNRHNNFWALRKFKPETTPSIFQLVTAEPLAEGQERHGILAEEVGTWARPPGAVLAKAAKTMKFKKSEPVADNQPAACESVQTDKSRYGRSDGHPRHRVGNRTEFRRLGERAAAESLDLIDLYGVDVRFN